MPVRKPTPESPAPTGATNPFVILPPSAPIYSEKYYPHHGGTAPKPAKDPQVGKFVGADDDKPDDDEARDLPQLMQNTLKVLDSRKLPSAQKKLVPILLKWMRKSDPSWTSPYFVLVLSTTGGARPGQFSFDVTSDRVEAKPAGLSSYAQYLEDYKLWYSFMQGSERDFATGTFREELRSVSDRVKAQKKDRHKQKMVAAPKPTPADPDSKTSLAKKERQRKRAEAEAKAKKIQEDREASRARLRKLQASEDSKHESKVLELRALKKLQEVENSVAKVVAKRSNLISKTDRSAQVELQIDSGWKLVTSKKKRRKQVTRVEGPKAGDVKVTTKSVQFD